MVRATDGGARRGTCGLGLPHASPRSAHLYRAPYGFADEYVWRRAGGSGDGRLRHARI